MNTIRSILSSECWDFGQNNIEDMISDPVWTLILISSELRIINVRQEL